MKNLALGLCVVMLLNSSPAFTHGSQKHGGERIKLSVLGRIHLGPHGSDAAEIVSFDVKSNRAFVTNTHANSIDVVSIAKPASPIREFSIDIKPYGKVNSVAYKNGLVAAAVQAKNPQENGWVLVFDTSGELLNKFVVGAMPDMVTFTPDGKHILSANEGEPNDAYTIDPEGSVSIIDLGDKVGELTQDDVRTADFKAFNNGELDSKVRIFGKNAKPSQDLEPEYITISSDSKTAWISLQENNALAELNIEQARIEKIVGLGTLPHNNAKTAIDASEDDDKINIKPWPVEGLYLPDTIANYKVGGKTFIVTANEGDARDYSGYSEERQVSELELEPAFTDAYPGLSAKENLGGLKVSTVGADTDSNGKVDKLYSFGTRSFSIWDANGTQVYDSGSQFARIVARDYPAMFNLRDTRSNDKGPEPEALTLGKIGNATFAFIGFERTGGVMVYNITEPENAFYVDYLNTISSSLEPDDPNAGDQAPESLVFVSAEDSPNGKALLISANEYSSTLAIYQIDLAAPKHH